MALFSDIAALEKKDQRNLFDLVARLVREPPVPGVHTSNDEKLRLYGLYKHVTDGPCSGKESPSVFHAAARSKYQAWLDCQDLSFEHAISAYIQLIFLREDALGQQCQALVESFLATKKSTKNQSITSSVQQPTFNTFTKPKKPLNPMAATTCSPSLLGNLYEWISNLLIQLCQLMGIRPLIPRGRLDISYWDLFYAMGQCCLWWRWTPYHCHQKSREIRELFGEEGAIAGFSVRSLLDLYLTAKNFPEGSQVIVVPPISVPGMMHVLRHHNIDIVPIDVPDASESEWYDPSVIRCAITSKTIAIMVVHPFGMICTSTQQLESLRNLADDHKIELWEDCAECYMGLGDDCYRGNVLADVRLFSFGMIKTTTALGGGIAVFRDPASRRDLERQQLALTQRQSTIQFFRRLLLALILNLIADSPWRVGLLAKACSLLGMEFDDVVTTSLRGFRIQQSTNDEIQRVSQRDLICQIRKRPSYALLALLHRRLFQSKHQMARSVIERTLQCTEMKTILSRTMPQVLVPYGANKLTTNWAFPILCSNRDTASRILVNMGFDVVSGASQLCCVSAFSSDDRSCTNAAKLMDSILYVPIASQKLLHEDLERLADALKYAIETAENDPGRDDIEPLVVGCWKTQSAFVILVAGLPLLLVLVSQLSVKDTLYWMYWLGAISAANTLTCLLLAVMCVFLLRLKVSSLYLQESTAFAEHCDMIDAATTEEPQHADSIPGNNILSQIESLNLTGLSQVPGGRTIVLTGATGFVGSLVLRDLLLERENLSLKCVILIIREKKGETAASRISKLLKKPMYSFLSDKDVEQRVEVLSGDVTQSSAGLSHEDFDRVVNDPTITHVLHCAAAVSFSQELPDAARSNITSSLNMQTLTSRLVQKGAKFVHISTAFIHGGSCGSLDAPLNEELFPLSPFEAERIYRSMLGTQFYASKAMVQLRFPNSYTLSKCVCEHLLLRQKTVDTIIIRPSIVCPSVESPFEGWAGDKPTTIVAGACLHLLNQWNIWYLEPNSVPYIPVDVLSRFILAKVFEGNRTLTVDADTASCSDGSFERLSQASLFSESEETLSIESKQISHVTVQRIFNATWDSSSESAKFSWLEFSVSYLQLGCVLGYFNRSLAYVTLFVSTHLTPQLCSNDYTYQQIHDILIRGPLNILVWFFENMSISTSHIKKLLPFLDLPLLFFPFVRQTYHFRSELSAPSTFNAKRYVFSIGVAAHRFISEKVPVTPSSPNARSLGVHMIGGRDHRPRTTDFWWATSQPRGNLAVRLSGWIFVKILRLICTAVTIDVVSFRGMDAFLRGNKKDDNKFLILAPTHRSFFDSILISFAIFSIPELQLQIPYIIAADDFEYLPLVGMLAKMLRALYIQRGRGQEDPNLRDLLRYMKQGDLLENGASLEVFLEGARSRDRRFLRPRTGFLKSLDQTGGNHVVVPITINYERIPEQTNLSNEASSSRRGHLNVAALIAWLKNVIAGRVTLGKIHIVAGTPLRMECRSRDDFGLFAREIQQHHQNQVVLSDYHVRAIAAILDLPYSVVIDAVSSLGCKLWPSPVSESSLAIPSDKSELLSVSLQAGYLFAPLFEKSHPAWSRWLNHHYDAGSTHPDIFDENTTKIHERLAALFDSAASAVIETVDILRARGFVEPDHAHIFQVARRFKKTDLPDLLIRAAIQIHAPESPASNALEETLRREPFASQENIKVNCDKERLGFWGFADSGFVLKWKQPGPLVTMTGDKYNLCGRSLTKLLPFIETELNIQVDPLREFPSLASIWCAEVKSSLSDDDICFLQERFSMMSVCTKERVRHGTGHSQEDVFAIRSGASIRLPDAVVWPLCQDDILVLVQAARERSWCLIPFGGGTNVSNATRCPEKDVEPRPIISVDMKEMKRFLWLNYEDGLAHVEAGITGKSLVEELEHRGYTMGHEPDSIEFSTLGGWVATKASGMKRSRYGNIEDIVMSVSVVTSQGVLWKGSEQSDVVPGRVAEGIDIRSIVTGSEGCLGIITSAVIRIWPMPEVRKFDSIVFPCFEAGLNFARELSKKGAHIPASIRLLDNAHFRLGQALRPDASSLFERVKDVMTKIASLIFLGHLDHNSVVCATIGYEGSLAEVNAQESIVKELSIQYGGTRLGPKVGKAGYDLTFMIAYLRDFAMTYHVLGESFETFVPWSKIERLISATKDRIKEEHFARLLPGEPFVGCRVTQLYHEGVCLYFYLCMSFDGVKNASSVYSDMETAVREEILKQGGSLSHHHGIGKHRAQQMAGRMSPAFARTLNDIKGSIDEDNIFGARNGPFAFAT